MNCSTSATDWCVSNDFVSATQISLPVHFDIINGLSYMSSWVPTVYIVVLFIAMVLKPTPTKIAYLSVFASSLILNEFLIKPIVSQPRPCGTCLCPPNHRCQGMPSSHSVVSIATYTFFLLEFCFRRQYSIASKPTSTGDASRGYDDTKKVIFIVLVVTLLFLPVPISRVMLLDHSVAQISIGSMIGVLFGSLNFLVRHVWLPELPGQACLVGRVKKSTLVR